MSSRYAEVHFEHKLAAPANSGFTVSDVIAFVHEYYTGVFTPEEVAQIRYKVARGEIEDDYVKIIAQKPQNVLTWSLPAAWKEEHINNYLAHFDLSRDGSLEDRMLRVAFHCVDHKVWNDQLTKAAQLPFAEVYFWPIPSLSLEQMEKQCKALGLSDHLDERKLTEYVQRGGALAALAQEVSEQEQATCVRYMVLGDMRRFEGFEIETVSARSITVTVRLGS